MQTFPAVSVIIPLYNAEKYIADCLDSILAQTFQNFEVIVVDDCSTDSSCAIVESYAPKFYGRLQLEHTKKNSGGCAIPRNIGLAFSRGEYIFFVDADDTITPTALEELYKLAKEYDADVIHCEKYYDIPDEYWSNVEFRKNLKPYSYQLGKLVSEPTSITADIFERAKMFHRKEFIWHAWNQLIRRNFLIRNELSFGDFFAEDIIFKMGELCTAEKYILVPNVVYCYRRREGSIMTDKADVQRRIQRQIKALLGGIEWLDKFLSDREFLAQRTDLKYLLFDMFVQDMLKYLTKIYAQVPAHELDALVRNEFSANGNVALTSFIFSTMNVQHLQLMMSRKRITDLEAEIKRLQTNS